MTAPARPGQVTCQRVSPWRDLRHAALGAALGLTIIYATAGAEDDVQVIRPPDAVRKTVMNLGDHLCSFHGSDAVDATNLSGGMMQFTCRVGTIIKVPVIIK